MKNFVWVYQLNQDITHLHQGEKSLGSYFASSKRIWEEFDHYETFKLACQKDIVVYKNKVERT